MFVGLRYFRLVTALATLTLVAACSKHDPKPATDPIGMRWTVDGNEATAYATQEFATANTIEIRAGAGSTTGGVEIELILPKKAGTYDLAIGEATARYETINSSSSTSNYKAKSGTIIVTNLTATTIKGAFNFSGEDVAYGKTTTKTITNGKFNIAL